MQAMGEAVVKLRDLVKQNKSEVVEKVSYVQTMQQEHEFKLTALSK